MTKYLLTCQCGQKLPVRVSQAGETLTCQCGVPLEIPPMRDLRQLEQVGDAQPDRPGTSHWSPQRGLIFVIGVTVSLVSFPLAGYLLIHRAGAEQVAPVDVAQLRHEIETWTPGQSWEEWKKLKTRMLKRPAVDMSSTESAYALPVALGGGVAGLLAAAAALLVGSTPRRR